MLAHTVRKCCHAELLLHARESSMSPPSRTPCSLAHGCCAAGHPGAVAAALAASARHAGVTTLLARVQHWRRVRQSGEERCEGRERGPRHAPHASRDPPLPSPLATPNQLAQDPLMDERVRAFHWSMSVLFCCLCPAGTGTLMPQTREGRCLAAQHFLSFVVLVLVPWVIKASQRVSEWSEAGRVAQGGG